jgi:hypothetical protein
MEIPIKPQTFTGHTSWQSKLDGVILVEREEDIEPLWKLLIEQDDYWEHYKEVIKVAPKEINGIQDISRMCVYVGKTDIYNPKELQSKIPFIMYQEYCTI